MIIIISLIGTLSIPAIATSSSNRLGTENTLVGVTTSEDDESQTIKQLDLMNKAKKDSLSSLLIGKQFPQVTRPYIMSIITLICLPESSSCKRSLSIAVNYISDIIYKCILLIVYLVMYL